MGRLKGKLERKASLTVGSSVPFLDVSIDGRRKHMSPGWYVDDSGLLRNIYQIEANLAAAGTIFQQLYDATLNSMPWSYRPDGTQVDQSEAWIAFQKDITLSGGAAANTQILAAKAATRYEVMILNAHVHSPVDSTSPADILIELQDEDDASLSPAVEVGILYLYDVSTPQALGGQFYADCQPWAYWGTTPTANKALEMDISGGNGTEVVHVSGIYRELK